MFDGVMNTIFDIIRNSTRFRELTSDLLSLEMSGLNITQAELYLVRGSYASLVWVKGTIYIDDIIHLSTVVDWFLCWPFEAFWCMGKAAAELIREGAVKLMKLMNRSVRLYLGHFFELIKQSRDFAISFIFRGLG